MFTRCPECGTVFRVTANQLRVAQGDVRCGNCAHIFNAMEFLADDLPNFAPADDAASTEDGNTATPEMKFTGQDIDSLEFDAPEQTWSEFFIEARATAGDIALDGELEAITANPEEWKAMLAEIGADEKGISLGVDPDASPVAANQAPDQETEPAAPGGEEEDATNDEFSGPVYVVESWKLDAANDPPADAPAEDESETVASEITEFIEMSAVVPEPTGHPDLPPWTGRAEEEESETAPANRLRWAVIALILCVTLGAQLMHYSRDALAAHPRYGEPIRDFYARLDERLYPAWSLSAFSVRRSEALAGGTAPNALDINAAVEVGGAHPIGLPLLRVTLRDQWANTVGSRIFLPDEYLAAALPPIVPPGTRIPVTLSLADPGTAARGYEVDLCLPRRQIGLECQLAQRPLRP